MWPNLSIIKLGKKNFSAEDNLIPFLFLLSPIGWNEGQPFLHHPLKVFREMTIYITSVKIRGKRKCHQLFKTVALKQNPFGISSGVCLVTILSSMNNNMVLILDKSGFESQLHHYSPCDLRQIASLVVNLSIYKMRTWCGKENTNLTG